MGFVEVVVVGKCVAERGQESPNGVAGLVPDPVFRWRCVPAGAKDAFETGVNGRETRVNAVAPSFSLPYFP